MPSARVLLRMIRTFTLTYFAWIFFRASSLNDAAHILGKIVHGPFSMSFHPDLANSLQANGPVLMGLLVLVLWEWLARRRWLSLLPEVAVAGALVWLQPDLLGNCPGRAAKGG